MTKTESRVSKLISMIFTFSVGMSIFYALYLHDFSYFFWSWSIVLCSTMLFLSMTNPYGPLVLVLIFHLDFSALEVKGGHIKFIWPDIVLFLLTISVVLSLVAGVIAGLWLHSFSVFGGWVFYASIPYGTYYFLIFLLPDALSLLFNYEKE